MKIRVEWDFGDTEYQDAPYREAISKSELPDEVKLPPDVAYEDDDGITDWLSDTYGYTVLDWYAL